MTRPFAFLMFVGFFGLFATFAYASPLPQGHRIRVDALSGSVRALLPKGASALLSVGDRVLVGSRVKTSVKAWAALKWEDGTLLRLRGNSLVELTAEGFRLHRGDSWIRVAKVGKRFEALTYNAVASVRGTCFTVSSRLNTSAVSGVFKERGLNCSAPMNGSWALRVGTAQILDWVSAFFTLEPRDFTMTTCKVFEGRVLFSPRDHKGNLKAGVLLRPSLVACVVGDEASLPIDMEGTDFRDQGPGFLHYPTKHFGLDLRLSQRLRYRNILRRRYVPSRHSRRKLRNRRPLHTAAEDNTVLEEGNDSDQTSLELILDQRFNRQRKKKKKLHD